MHSHSNPKSDSLLCLHLNFLCIALALSPLRHQLIFLVEEWKPFSPRLSDPKQTRNKWYATSMKKMAAERPTEPNMKTKTAHRWRMPRTTLSSSKVPQSPT